ncbi:MAG TPA: hypothetical protein VK116_00200, partial [Planctomycetota bacterium]|nr:hypothetical protein [Planctomycetota bacterium]
IEWYPAASFGEIGTASVAAGACLVTRAFERGYAPASRAAVVCSAVTRERGGIAMTYVERRR